MKKATLTLLMSMAFSYLYCANTKDMTKLTNTGRVSNSISINYPKEHHAWTNIKARCYNPKRKDYKNYGGRGIQMCDSWRCSFKSFLDYIGCAPAKEYSIDRIDNNGNYEPGNVRWATKKTQSNNKRNSIIISYDGHTRTLSEWSRELNISYSAAFRAIKLNKNTVGVDQAFIDWLAPKSKLPIYKERSTKPTNRSRTKKVRIKKRQEPKYYHDLHDIIAKYGLTPLGFR